MAKFGIVGLDTMGVGLCANAIQEGHEVVGFNRTGSKTLDAADYLAKEYSIDKAFTPARSAEEFTEHLSAEDPPIVVMLVKAGEPTWKMFQHLSLYLPKGTILLDMANEHPADTTRFEEIARGQQIRWLGTGISGGRKGAEALNKDRGPAIMAGGDEATYRIVEPILTDLAAKPQNGGPCCGWFGPGMAGHRVKNIHNGIEYDFMMCMGEAYAALQACGQSPDQIAKIFQRWVEKIPELQGYLMGIAIQGLCVKAEDGSPLVLKVVDEAKAKGTGKYTSQIAMDEGVPIPGIDMAVLARCLSAFRSRRQTLARQEPHLEYSEELCDRLRDALFCNMIMSYDHGFMLLRATQEEHGYKIDRVKVSEVWRGGCIIKSHLLPRIRKAFQDDEGNDNGRFTLINAPFFQEEFDQRQRNWREAVSTMILAGIPCLASCGNLGAYDSLRTARLDAASFNQMLRDTFGDHTFTRFDEDGTWTCDWDGDGTIRRLE